MKLTSWGKNYFMILWHYISSDCAFWCRTVGHSRNLVTCSNATSQCLGGGGWGGGRMIGLFSVTGGIRHAAHTHTYTHAPGLAHCAVQGQQFGRAAPAAATAAPRAPPRCRRQTEREREESTDYSLRVIRLRLMDILDTIVLWKSSPTREAFKIAFVITCLVGVRHFWRLLLITILYKNKLDFQSKTIMLRAWDSIPVVCSYGMV